MDRADIWDLTPDAGGEPVRLSVPAVDAKEWHARHPDRYALVPSVIIWNIDPDGRSEPQKMVLPIAEGQELLASDPGPYRRKNPREVLLKALEFERTSQNEFAI